MADEVRVVRQDDAGDVFALLGQPLHKGFVKVAPRGAGETNQLNRCAVDRDVNAIVADHAQAPGVEDGTEEVSIMIPQNTKRTEAAGKFGDQSADGGEGAFQVVHVVRLIAAEKDKVRGMRFGSIQ